MSSTLVKDQLTQFKIEEALRTSSNLSNIMICIPASNIHQAFVQIKVKSDFHSLCWIIFTSQKKNLKLLILIHFGLL